MPLQKIEFMYDIPDGYRFVRFGAPNNGDLYLTSAGKVTKALWEYSEDWIIIEKIPEQEQPTQLGLKLQYKTQHGDWRDVDDGYEYRIKPKTKIIRFRNFLHSIGIIMATYEDISDRDYFVKWLGDWQNVEIEEND